MDKNKQEVSEKKKEENPAIQPDPETLHKTDPQDNMKGPISSLVQGVKEEVEDQDLTVKKNDGED